MSDLTDEFFMTRALEAAIEAETRGEIPIGACIIDNEGNIISAAGNRTGTDCDPTAHAEIIVLREASKKTGNYRLTETTLYTTIEPCAMCAGAIIQARVKRLVFGAHDLRFGAIETMFRICDGSLNHQPEITSGILADESRRLMQNFFRRRRQENKVISE